MECGTARQHNSGAVSHMTPLLLGKRLANNLKQLCENPPAGANFTRTNHMNIVEKQYSVPGPIIYSLGERTVKFFMLRSGFTVSILTVPSNSSSHKHTMAADPKLQAWFLVYTGENSTQLEYWDPRTNREQTTTLELGNTFILSTQHRFLIDNWHSNTPAQFLAVNTQTDWAETAKHFQHRW